MRDFGGRDRWLPTPGLPRDGRQASRPLAVGCVLDVPGFEALLEPVHWLVLGVPEGEVTLVAIDRGVAGEGDVSLPRVAAALGVGMSGWTVRCALVRRVAAATVARVGAIAIGSLHPGLLDRVSHLGAAGMPVGRSGSSPRSNAACETAQLRRCRSMADQLLPLVSNRRNPRPPPAWANQPQPSEP
jgi:hypothetical protein